MVGGVKAREGRRPNICGVGVRRVVCVCGGGGGGSFKRM